MSGGYPVVSAPVVRELEVVFSLYQLKPALKECADLAVAVDLPQSRDEVGVGGQPGGADAVAKVIDVGWIFDESQVMDASSAGEQCPQACLGGEAEDVLAGRYFRGGLRFAPIRAFRLGPGLALGLTARRFRWRLRC